MYKIIGKFYNKEINREATDADYAIGIFMAYIQEYMKYNYQYTASDAIDEAIDVATDVYTNDLPHYYELTEDMWLELQKETKL